MELAVIIVFFRSLFLILDSSGAASPNYLSKTGQVSFTGLIINRTLYDWIGREQSIIQKL